MSNQQTPTSKFGRDQPEQESVVEHLAETWSTQSTINKQLVGKFKSQLHSVADLVFTIQTIHDQRVDQNQYNKDVDRPLLGHPEPQAEVADRNKVHRLNKENTQSKTNEKPDRQQDHNDLQVRPPVLLFA